MFVFFEKFLLQIPNLHEKLRIKFSKRVSIGLRPKKEFLDLIHFWLGLYGGGEGGYLNSIRRLATLTHPPPPRVKKGVSRPYPLLARFPRELRTNIDVKVFDCERSERVIFASEARRRIELR